MREFKSTSGVMGSAINGFPNTIEKYIDKLVSHLTVREPEVVVAKDVPNLRLVKHHSDKRAGSQCGIDGPKGAVADALLDVASNVILHFASG